MNYKSLSLSNLSLIMFNENNSKDIRKKAQDEILRRFKGTACHFQEFHYYEERVIEKRGIDKDNYLIGSNPTMQQLMNIYFSIILNYRGLLHNEILFSEVHLCNDDAKNTFFESVFELEYGRVNKRLENYKTDINSKETLLLVKEIFEHQRMLNNAGQKRENAATELLCDIVIGPDFKYNPEKVSKLMRFIEKENVPRIIRFLISAYASLDENELLNYIYMNRFLGLDSRKLSNQKACLLKDVKTGNQVNYESEDIAKVLYKN